MKTMHQTWSRSLAAVALLTALGSDNTAASALSGSSPGRLAEPLVSKVYQLNYVDPTRCIEMIKPTIAQSGRVVTVQAATWVDVTALEVVVDGQMVDIIPILPADAEPGNPAVRWRGQVPVQVRATGGFVVIAAYGDQPLEPVHPGKIPFGVTEPIFVVP